MEIATLISGGVDSSVAVHLLNEAGLKQSLFYIRIGMDEEGFTDCSSEDDITFAKNTARRYGCPFEIVDLHREYWDNVVRYTIDTVKKGLTPNPDVMCNKLIKFGSFEEKIGCNFDKTATGHYATTTLYNGKTYLSTAKDPIKDQTDFLAQINSLQISKLMFPIGHLLKGEVRQIADHLNLPSARRKDSQGICFLGKINYNDFIRRYMGEKEGQIIESETGRILGKHRGYWFHTIGQRKGLGLSQGPWYVIGKDVEQNIIYVSAKGYGESVSSNSFFLRNFNFITDNLWGQEVQDRPVCFKIRHTPEFMRGTISYQNNTFRIDSVDPVCGVAPGQFGVVYDDQARICIGSGEICE